MGRGNATNKNKETIISKKRIPMIKHRKRNVKGKGEVKLEARKYAKGKEENGKHEKKKREKYKTKYLIEKQSNVDTRKKLNGRGSNAKSKQKR